MKNKANEELVVNLSKIFKSQVSIETGGKSKQKVILIHGMSLQNVEDILKKL